MASLILLTETPDRHICPLGKATLMVGSDDQSDLHLPSATISKDHASIIFENGSFVLADNGSISGSFVNGEPISRRVLKHQDLIRFGEYLFMVDLDDEVDEDIFKKPLEESSSSHVKVSEGKDGFSKVVNISQPDISKRTTQNLRDKRTSQNIRLLLSDPVPNSQQAKQPRKASASVKIDEFNLGHRSGFNAFYYFVMVPLVMIVTALLTLHFLPLEVRDLLVRSEGFKQVPLNDSIGGLVLREGTNQKEIVGLQPGVTYGTKMTLPREVLIKGKLQLGLRPSKPVNLHLYIKSNTTGTTKPVTLFEKSVEIKPGSEEVELFSKILPVGTYNFECIWENQALIEENSSSTNGEASPTPKDEISRKRLIPGTLFLTSWS